jgi:hypothetical protein
LLQTPAAVVGIKSRAALALISNQHRRDFFWNCQGAAFWHPRCEQAAQRSSVQTEPDFALIRGENENY